MVKTPCSCRLVGVVAAVLTGGLTTTTKQLGQRVIFFFLQVIGVCGTEDKADLVREKGAWAALKYNKKHLEKKVCLFVFGNSLVNRNIIE